MLRSPIVRRLSVTCAAILAAVAAPPAQAQEEGPVQEWSLQNIRAAWCVHFLMDSASADKELPRDFRTVRAADFPDLSPAIGYLINGEPEYQAWVPARWCSLYFDQGAIGTHGVGEAGAELKDVQYLGVWLIGSARTSGTETSPSWYINTLRTPNWRLIRSAETALIRIQHAEREMGKVPEHTDDRYRVEMGKTVITWDGRLAGDSASAAPESRATWWSVTTRGAPLRTDVLIRAEKLQPVVGSLQVTGNDDLAKSLRASPIRMVGPLVWGGTAQLAFFR